MGGIQVGNFVYFKAKKKNIFLIYNDTEKDEHILI